MSTSRPTMGILHKWQIVKGYKRRFFANYYSYSVYLDCDKRPHLQVSRLSNPRSPLSSPKDYEYEYDSYLRKTLTTSRQHHSGSLHTCSVIIPLPSPTLGLPTGGPRSELCIPHTHIRRSPLSLSRTASASGAHGLC